MKKLIILFAAAVIGMVFAAGCGGSGNGGGSEDAVSFVLAKDNATDYSIVSYFSDDSIADEYKTTLTIKTGAQFTVAKEASGKAIYIGTAKELAGKGGTDPGITYSQYEIRANGDDLIISVGTEVMAKDVSGLLRAMIVKLDDGSFAISSESFGIKNVCEISEVVPMFETESGEMQELHDCGFDHYEVIYSGLDKSGADAEIAAYEKQLSDAGYTLFQENEIANNRFVTYTKGDTEIHCNYFYLMHEFRIIYGKLNYLGPQTPVTDYEKVTEPTISEIGMSESVQCNVIQLADGSFVVIDGGWGSDADKTYSYKNDAGETVEKTYHRDYKADMKALWDFLESKAPQGTKPQVTWMITHADPDHICLFPPFLKEYSSKFDLKTIIYNFPNLYNIGLGTGNSTNDPVTFTGYITAFIDSANAYYPDVNHYIYHTGQKLYLPGCEIEFLMSHEDFWPHEMPWMNDTCGAWRFTFDDSKKTAFFLGDCTEGMNNMMAQIFGDYLKSDIFQPAHHGSNGGTLALYRLVDPEVCFWTCADFPFYNDARHTGTKEGWDFNAFLRNSQKVKYHFTNSETHTLIVSTLEEEK